MVKVGDLTIANAEILSNGVGKSTGILIFQGDKQIYIPSNAKDIEALIQGVSDIIGQVALVLTGLDAVTVSPGTQAAAIAQLQVLKTQLLATKEGLA